MWYLRGDLDAATSHFRRALACFQDAGHRPGEAMLLGNLGLVHGERGDRVTALWYTTRGLELCADFGYERGRALKLDTLGVARYAAGEFDRPSSVICGLTP